MFSTNKFSKQSASTLVEVLVAITVIALVLTAVGAMISMSVKLADGNEKQQLALQKAQEALEFFRKERAINSWSSFSTTLTDGAVYCLNSLPSGVADLSTQLGECNETSFLEVAHYQFQRQANISFSGANSLTVEIELLWQNGNKAKNLSLQQSFENY